MTLQSTGELALSEIAAEFGGSIPHALSDYYSAATGIRNSGTLSISDFYGKQSQVPPPIITYEESYAKFDPNQIYHLTKTGGVERYQNDWWFGIVPQGFLYHNSISINNSTLSPSEIQDVPSESSLGTHNYSINDLRFAILGDYSSSSSSFLRFYLKGNPVLTPENLNVHLTTPIKIAVDVLDSNNDVDYTVYFTLNNRDSFTGYRYGQTSSTNNQEPVHKLMGLLRPTNGGYQNINESKNVKLRIRSNVSSDESVQNYKQIQVYDVFDAQPNLVKQIPYKWVRINNIPQKGTISHYYTNDPQEPTYTTTLLDTPRGPITGEIQHFLNKHGSPTTTDVTEGVYLKLTHPTVDLSPYSLDPLPDRFDGYRLGDYAVDHPTEWVISAFGVQDTVLIKGGNTSFHGHGYVLLPNITAAAKALDTAVYDYSLNVSSGSTYEGRTETITFSSQIQV